MAHQKVIPDEAIQEAINRVKHADLKSLEAQYAFHRGPAAFDEYVAKEFAAVKQRVAEAEERIRQQLAELERRPDPSEHS